MTKIIRWTIARKVGGIVFVLLLIILGLLIHSVISLKKIELELNEIAKIDIPLTEYANEIEIAQLEQRILLDEFMSKGLNSEKTNEQEVQAILKWSDKINAEFELAIKAAQQGVNSNSQAIFVSILSNLEALELKHAQIELSLKKVLTEQGEQVEFDALIEQDKEFDRLAIDVIHSIERLAKKNANTVLKHEQQFAFISYSLGGIGGVIGISLALIVIIGIKSSVSKISQNINLVSSAIESNKDIPIDQVKQVQTSDEFGELSENLANMIEQVSTDITTREEKSKQLNDLATKDHLTQCFNRFKWDESRELEISRSLNSELCLSLIFFDIDHFKKINDTFGHDIGDRTLIDVVKVTQQTIRQLDSLFRTGGEEFSVLLPNTELDKAVQMAERIRKAIAEYHFETVGQVTISLGVTYFKGEGDNESLFAKRADSALYKSKEGGRNCVSTLV